MQQILQRFRGTFLSAVNLNLMVLAWIIFVTADPFDVTPKLTGLRSLGYWAVTVVYSSTLLCFLIVAYDEAHASVPRWLGRVFAALVYGAVSVSFGRVVFVSFAAEPEKFGWPQFQHYAFGTAIGMAVFMVVDLFRFALNRNTQEVTDVVTNSVAEDSQVPLSAPEAKTAKTSEIRLLKRVPPELNGALIRICAQDHFVQIYTEKGMHSIRMRFRDALAELPDDLGVLVHRSHWVAADQIDKTFKKDRKLFVRLKDGAEAPVGRNGETALGKLI